MISHVPLRRELGAGRVQLELSEELLRLGHSVSKFDYADAFGDGCHRFWGRVFSLTFAHRARDYVRQHSGRFDVIDAQQGDLPYSKSQLGFDGLLVTRSLGLYAFYERYRHHEKRTWPDRLPGTPPGRALTNWVEARVFAACKRSLQRSDLINLPSREELSYVRRTLDLGDRCVVIPFGVTDEHASSLQRAMRDPRERLRRKEVTFVGHWSLRKGAADWPKIVALTSRLVPDVRFSFLGVGVQPDLVLGEFAPELRSRLRVVPSYRSAELPSLLRESVAGALPSYVEGWSLGLLEQLTAGIPTVAYGSAVPKAMIADIGRPLTVPAGDAAAFSRRLAEIISMSAGDYATLAGRCRDIVRDFRWGGIAKKTLSCYNVGLGRASSERSKPRTKSSALSGLGLAKPAAVQ